MDQTNTKPSPLIEATAGLAAGVVSTLAVHPLDLLKLRLQVNRSPPQQIGASLRLMRSIFLNEGGFRALYRGLAPNLLGNSASWALYFMWYDMSKNAISKLYGGHARLSYYDYFVASASSGVLTAICTNPIWVIKTRMLSTASSHVGAYSSTTDGIRRILRSEGFCGFYRGLVPSLFGVAHGALQFMAYEQMKTMQISRPSDGENSLSNWDYLLFGGTSKVFAGSITYPYQVVRSRLQTYDAQHHYKSARDVVIQLWRQEGLRGLYKGIGPNLLRVVPSSCVTFLVYENTKAGLSGIVLREP